MLTRRALFVLASLVGLTATIARSVRAQSAPPITNENMRRADELLTRMTVEEKVMQLSCVVPLALLNRSGLMRDQADKLLTHGIGHVAGIGLLGHKSPESIAKSVNAIQRYLDWIHTAGSRARRIEDRDVPHSDERACLYRTDG